MSDEEKSYFRNGFTPIGIPKFDRSIDNLIDRLNSGSFDEVVMYGNQLTGIMLTLRLLDADRYLKTISNFEEIISSRFSGLDERKQEEHPVFVAENKPQEKYPGSRLVTPSRRQIAAMVLQGVVSSNPDCTREEKVKEAVLLTDLLLKELG